MNLPFVYQVFRRNFHLEDVIMYLTLPVSREARGFVYLGFSQYQSGRGPGYDGASTGKSQGKSVNSSAPFSLYKAVAKKEQQVPSSQDSLTAASAYVSPFS